MKNIQRKIGKETPNWKGDQVGTDQLHAWFRKHFPQPAKCQMCKRESERLDLANKSGQYKRDLTDWLWLCRKCHKRYDCERRNHCYKIKREGKIVATGR